MPKTKPEPTSLEYEGPRNECGIRERFISPPKEVTITSCFVAMLKVAPFLLGICFIPYLKYSIIEPTAKSYAANDDGGFQTLLALFFFQLLNLILFCVLIILLTVPFTIFLLPAEARSRDQDNTTSNTVSTSGSSNVLTDDPDAEEKKYIFGLLLCGSLLYMSVFNIFVFLPNRDYFPQAPAKVSDYVSMVVYSIIFSEFCFVLLFSLVKGCILIVNLIRAKKVGSITETAHGHDHSASADLRSPLAVAKESEYRKESASSQVKWSNTEWVALFVGFPSFLIGSGVSLIILESCKADADPTGWHSKEEKQAFINGILPLHCLFWTFLMAILVTWCNKRPKAKHSSGGYDQSFIGDKYKQRSTSDK